MIFYNYHKQKGNRLAAKTMKILVVLIFMLTVSNALAQFENPESVSVSYFGEMISHPGIKLGADFVITKWDKTRYKDEEFSKVVNKSLMVSPTLGMFYHRRYQTGLFIMPEAKYKRQNSNGRFFELGLGAGYLRTFIPKTFEVLENAEVKKTSAGHNYFSTNYFLSFGKDLSIKSDLPIAYFIKPQFMYAVPNFPKGTGYFALEIGIRYLLK